MRKLRIFTTLIAGAVAALSAPAPAQYIGGNAPPPPAVPTGPETASAALGRQVRILAANPRNFEALVAAGRAELELGDLNAAAGFFGRADEIQPGSPAPKIGMGAIAAQNGDPGDAMAWFARAQSLGATPLQMGSDRGLAQDLLGNQGAAQSDYRAAMNGSSANEARRRLALSLAISGRSSDALTALEPLLRNRDPAAQRTRAFVLALGGNRGAADAAIEAAMPGSSRQIDPFFAILPRLTPTEKAAAVHLGLFPDPGATARPSQSSAIVVPAPIAPPSLPARTITTQFAESGKQVRAPSATSTQPPPPVAGPYRDAAPNSVQAPAVSEATTIRLADLDRALAASTSRAKSQPSTGLDRKAAAAAKKAADAKKAVELKKIADFKKIAEAKKTAELAEKMEKAEAAKLGTKGTYWVQIAGGSNAERMSSEYRRIKARKPALFSGRTAYVTAGKDYFRLLLGPFDDASDAHAMVGKLDKAGIDSFTWTRSPPQIKIEKISS